MQIIFPTDYKSILERIDGIDPVQYGYDRNYLNGAVTYLSPYISRGVISTNQVLQSIVKKGFSPKQIESFTKELCWRDYFQRVAQHKNVLTDIKQPQTPVHNHEIPVAVMAGETGIAGIDQAIHQLYQDGYMHNHCRMYTASLVCNIAKSHWKHPSQWMYYHLLDGDWASNSCSWQWVAGANSQKKYFANQENINKYTCTNQSDTMLDKSYEALATMEIPAKLVATQTFDSTIDLPLQLTIKVDNNLPTFIYNYYNLDPLWHQGEAGNRVLLLEPNFFNTHPVSKKCIDFMLDLSKNIEGIQVFVGAFEELVQQHHLDQIYYKEHPLSIGYTGIEEQRAWMVPQVNAYFPSFFGYWKKVEKLLKK